MQQVEPSGSTRTNTFRPSPISRASLALGSMKLASGSLLKTAGIFLLFSVLPFPSVSLHHNLHPSCYTRSDRTVWAIVPALRVPYGAQESGSAESAV